MSSNLKSGAEIQQEIQNFCDEMNASLSSDSVRNGSAALREQVRHLSK